MSYNTADHRIRKNRLAIRAKRGKKNIEIFPMKTNRHFYLVVYDCVQKRDLYSVSTVKDLKDKKITKVTNKEAEQVGKRIGEWLVKNGLQSQVYFNKIHYKFHGRLKSAISGLNEIAGSVI